MVSQKLSLITIIFITIFLNANSQTGPGGVGANNGTSDLIMWYRPDNIISTTGNLIDSWSNSAGISDFDLSATTTLRPTLISGAINGYDEINFDGNNRLRTGNTLTTGNFVSNQASSIVVAKAENTTQKTSLYRVTGASSTRFLCHIPWDGNVYFDIGTCCGTNARIQINNVSGLTDYSIWSYDAHPTTGKQLYRNENLLQSRANTLTFTPNSSSQFYLGHGGFKGDITEVAIFKTKINKAQRIIIDNYLSAKYNQTLASNDFYTQDNSGNGNFDHDVAGIGQASDGTNQTDSQGTGIVRVNSASSLSNDDYLFWGEETKDPTYSFSTNTTNYFEQINSKWRISKTNDLGTVTVSFDISGIDLSGKQSCQPLQLVIDNDSDFSSPTSYDLTVTGNTATATGVSFNDSEYFTLQYLDQIIWDGTSYSNGSGTLNAPDDTDACLKLTIKSGVNANIIVNAHVREIEVEIGAVLNVFDGILLEVENNIIIDGTIDLFGESQLIQNHNTTSLNSGSGSLKTKQQGASNLFNYNYWSSPVNTGGYWQIGNLEDETGVINFHANANGDPTTSPITLSSIWLYEFNAISGAYSEWKALTTTSNISPGIGYTMKGSGNSNLEQEYTFKGIPNDGNYSYPVNAGNELLAGNPYPSALDADQFINDNLSVIDGTLYFWEQFSTNNSHNLKDYEGGYAIYNLAMSLPAVADASGLTSGNGSTSKGAPKQNINTGQGFFVNIKNSGNLVFNNQQRVFARESSGETIFYKNNVKSKKTAIEDVRPKIRFSFTKSDSYTKYIGLAYDETASYNYDNGYDAKANESLKNDIFWNLNNENLTIQALHSINIEDNIQLSLYITDADTYKFSINSIGNFPDDVNVYLKDNEQNIYYDLKNEDALLFLSAEDEKNRFSVTFKKDTTLSLEKNDINSFLAFYNSDEKKLKLSGIDNLNDIKTVIITNTLGQEVLKLTSLKSNTIDMSYYSDGLYIIKTDFKNNKISKPVKFIKH